MPALGYSSDTVFCFIWEMECSSLVSADSLMWSMRFMVGWSDILLVSFMLSTSEDYSSAIGLYSCPPLAKITVAGPVILICSLSA